MGDYLCVDGPLSGHLYRSPDEPRVGEVATLGLVGIDGSTPRGGPQPEAWYVVDEAPRGARPGHLAYVIAHGLYRKPALPLYLRENAGL